MLPSDPLLTVVVPAWNEAVNLIACLAGLHATLAGCRYEVLIVDDGSRDDTPTLALQLASEKPDVVRVLRHASNLGLGAALRTGFSQARGTYVTCCPADFVLSLLDWRAFAAALGQADVLVGCRRQRAGYSAVMRINAWIYPRLVRVLFGLRLRDVNWICVYRRSLVEQVTLTQPGIPMLTEILVKLRDLGATFQEVDCVMQPRRAGTPSAARVAVMWRTLTGLFRFWWLYRRPAPLPSASQPASQGVSG